MKMRLMKPPVVPPRHRGDGVSRGVKYVAASSRNGMSSAIYLVKTASDGLFEDFYLETA
jgi:hypothetical protein